MILPEHVIDLNYQVMRIREYAEHVPPEQLETRAVVADIAEMLSQVLKGDRPQLPPGYSEEDALESYMVSIILQRHLYDEHWTDLAVLQTRFGLDKISFDAAPYTEEPGRYRWLKSGIVVREWEQ